MNFKLTKSNVKGKEETTLTISPSDGLERVFFNELFVSNTDVVFKTVPNSEEIVICKKEEKDDQKEVPK